MERLFGSIPEFVRGLGTHDAADRALAFAAWRRCAGTLLSERTEPIGFDNLELTIAVEDETWRKHLEDLAPQMLARLNQMVGQGEVKRLSFKIDPASLSARGSTSGKSTDAMVDVSDQIDSAANAIADTELREAFIKAASASLSSKNEAKP